MTDPNRTAIMLLVDRSGSMHAIKNSAEEAVNAFVNAQRIHDGNSRTVSLGVFDDVYELLIPSVDVHDCEPFKLEPRGSTALLDAMGRAIVEFGAELAELPEDERPGTVIFGVMTDGQENSSQLYTFKQVQALVRHQEKAYNWQIVYLGANQDAIATGAKLGVRADRSMSYAATDHGTRAVYDTFSASSVRASGIGGQSISFTDEDREDAMADEESTR